MKKAIGYLRVSTPEQNEERQRELIKTYCVENQVEYLDYKEIAESESGTNDKRQGLIKLLQLDSTDADMVIMSETSRLSRQDDIMNLLTSVNNILQSGLDLYILDSKKLYKGNSYLEPIDLMTLIFEAQANASERRKIVERTKTGRKSKASQGFFVGRTVPYGFTKYNNPNRIKTDDKEHGRYLLKVNEQQREIVETVFKLIGEQGYTMRGAAKYFNDLGILKGKVNWSLSGIMNVVYNPIYKGEYNYSNEVSKVPAIVSTELFEKVQIKLKSNHLFVNKGEVHYNILKGFFKCPCGGNFSVTTRADGRNYYNCVRKKNPHLKGNCKNKGIKADFVQNIIWTITQAFINKDDFQLQTEQATKNIHIEVEFKQKKLSEILDRIKKSDIEIEQATTNLLKVTDSNLFDIINAKASQLIKDKAELEKSKERIAKELTTLKNTIADFKLNIDTKLLQTLTEEKKNEIYRKYIDNVTYYSVNAFKGFINIKYKTGFESIIATATRHGYNAYQLPDSFTFNPDSRKVMTVGYKIKSRDKFSIGAPVKKEVGYADLEKLFNLEEFRMNTDYINNIEEQYQTEYNNKLSDI